VGLSIPKLFWFPPERIEPGALAVRSGKAGAEIAAYKNEPAKTGF
jgi:hypothetical protein